jgi:predicted DNA repair protein MutK
MLFAEIVFIALGSVKEAAFQTQVLVVSTLAITVEVYGLVAGIVKLDDLGPYLLKNVVLGHFKALRSTVGPGLLMFTTFLMKLLTVVGTIGTIAIFFGWWRYYCSCFFMAWSSISSA